MLITMENEEGASTLVERCTPASINRNTVSTLIKTYFLQEKSYSLSEKVPLFTLAS